MAGVHILEFAFNLPDKLAGEQLYHLRTFLGSVILLIGPKLPDSCGLQNAFGGSLRFAERVVTQRAHEDAGCYFHTMQAWEVESIIEVETHPPRESGAKVSVATAFGKPGPG